MLSCRIDGWYNVGVEILGVDANNVNGVGVGNCVTDPASLCCFDLGCISSRKQRRLYDFGRRLTDIIWLDQYGAIILSSLLLL